MKQFYLAWLVILALVYVALTQTTPPQIKEIKPTVILISLDGFRSDYLDKHDAPTLQVLARDGVRAKWMTPSFPSLTFPNHYAIATGLYPDHNGIVANNIYAPEFNETFSMSKRAEVENGRWWLGEPIWVTAEKQGQRSAAFFFPGTEAEIAGKRPSVWKTFDDDFPNNERVDTLLSWLEKPAELRPTMITLYFSDVDHGGHDAGPDSPDVKNAITRVDRALNRLVTGLKARGIFERVNLLIVSDHGMARVNPNNVVVLDDLFDLSLAQRIAWNGAMVHIFPKEGAEETIYAALKTKAAHLTVYRKTELPERFHYGSSPRIGSLVVLADEGWSLNSRERFKPVTSDSIQYRGAHGFDNQLESMRALFIGHGPAFKRAHLAEPFNNVDLYNVMGGILHLKPAPNDGNPATVKALLKP